MPADCEPVEESRGMLEKMSIRCSKAALSKLSMSALHSLRSTDHFHDTIEELVQERIREELTKMAGQKDEQPHLWFTNKDPFFMAGCLLREVYPQEQEDWTISDYLSDLEGNYELRRRLPRFLIGFMDLVSSWKELPNEWRSFETLLTGEMKRTDCPKRLKAQAMMVRLGNLSRPSSLFHEFAAVIVASQWSHDGQSKSHEKRCRNRGCCLKMNFAFRYLHGEPFERQFPDAEYVGLGAIYQQKASMTIQFWSREVYLTIRPLLNAPAAWHQTIDTIFAHKSIATKKFLDSLFTDDILLSVVRNPSVLGDFVMALLTTPTDVQSDEMAIAACSILMAVVQATMALETESGLKDVVLTSFWSVLVEIKRSLPAHRQYFFEFAHNKLKISHVENMAKCTSCSGVGCGKPEIDYMYWDKAQKHLVAETGKLIHTKV